MMASKAQILLLPLLAAHAAAYGSTLSLTQTVNGSPATLTVSYYYGGAINSFIYRGRQYIDVADLGRELQSAISFDGYGECLNPTEAGSANGVRSNVQSWSVQNSVLQTSTQMAYWLAPGQGGGVCGNGAVTAVNTTIHSDIIHQKAVSFGANGVPNVLNYDVTFNLPAQKNYASIEILTGYLPASFDQFLTFDAARGKLSRLPLTGAGCPGGSTCLYQDLPVIIATRDGQHSMGIYGTSGGAYGAYDHPSTSKWNYALGRQPAAAGAHSFNVKVPFGRVEEVTNAIRALTGGSLAPIFRFYNGQNHFLTLSYSEAASANYSFERTAFAAYSSAIDGAMAPIYRCRGWGADHFVSRDSNCEGQTFEGMLGYVSTYQRAGAVPVYRFYKLSLNDHLITTDFAEGNNNGYAYEDTIGYAPN